MISSSGADASGLAAAVREQLTALHVERALTLIAEALDEWRADGFVRWNDLEVSCTAIVHGRIDRLATRDAPLAELPVWPEYESPELTEAHIRGFADPAHARRRDLVLYFGRSREIRFPVECKRLIAAANGIKYVDEGMLRFVDGAYSAPLGACAMVGYVMTKTIGERVAEINDAVRLHAQLGSAALLRPYGAIPRLTGAQRSHHVSKDSDEHVEITHLFIDMRMRAPGNAELCAQAS